MGNNIDVRGMRSVSLLLHQELHLQTAKTFGDQNCKTRTGVFMAGSTCGAPGKVGIFAELKKERANWSVTLLRVVRFATILTFEFGWELFNDGTHLVSLESKTSFVKPDDRTKLIRESCGVSYKHARGINADLAFSKVGAFNAYTLDAQAKASIWSSSDNTNTLDLTGSATYHVDGPLAGKKRFSGGLKFTHHF
ncbi:attacin-A-like [Bactrocera neohumeralis]|uniref:attacin-A-like n=1 Tax=Bactrocera tryoni TaxID=59916 RepID=UPI001A96D411|nr:attacin-A-like [Bactrocera tryoni]XP_050317180.1 attacin-A-like [Bactrocera neohumeralis]